MEGSDSATASYMKVISKDVCRHQLVDSSCPANVVKFVQFIQEQVKLPTWSLKPDTIPHVDSRVLCMLELLRASDGASTLNLWDHSLNTLGEDMQQCLSVAFGAFLSDCASIRAVVDAEQSTQTPFPKESYLVVLVRNAILNATTGLSLLEDIPVALPCGWQPIASGEINMMLKYMDKGICVPLVLSVCEDMPIVDRNDGGSSQEQSEESYSGEGVEASDRQGNSSDYGEESSGHGGHSSYRGEGSDDGEGSRNGFEPEISISEFLGGRQSPEIIVEAEELQDDGVLSPCFDAHFIAYPGTATLPLNFHIPVFCMADGEQFPVVMSSLLYQRHIWHINDPLVGVEFTKYDTVIKVYVGWLEDHISPGCVLPRVHLGQIRTTLALDLSSPLMALVATHLLVSTQTNISTIRDTIRCLVREIATETQSQLSSSWRIDTRTQAKYPPSILENNRMERVLNWCRNQEAQKAQEAQEAQEAKEAKMPPRKKKADNRSTSATSTQPRQQPDHMEFSATNIPEIRVDQDQNTTEQDDNAALTFHDTMSCSLFAGSPANDSRVYRWLFDRLVIPRFVVADLEFYEDYKVMTSIIWPETWNTRKNLPLVDQALEPFIQELLQEVQALKSQPGTIQCIPPEKFPVDMRLLEHNFSAIFQACHRSQEKKRFGNQINEISWRHDHDRLLFDFFVRLIQTRNDGTPYSRDSSTVVPEDPVVRPALEMTLQLPKSDSFGAQLSQDVLNSLSNLIFDTNPRIFLGNKKYPQAVCDQEDSDYILTAEKWNNWKSTAGSQSMRDAIPELGKIPDNGRCDAVGRLIVELPGVSPEALRSFALIIHAKDTGSGSRNESRQATQPANIPHDSLLVPDVSSTTGRQQKSKTFNIPTSSVSSTRMESAVSDASTSLLVSPFADPRFSEGSARLELPILAIEYKKSLPSSQALAKGTNQLRMYLTAFIKFLEAIGITNFPVYGVQTDGPIVAFPAAVQKDGCVHLFERQAEKLDMSTPLGAWHYATILCRLAQNHAASLEKKFEAIKQNLSESLKSEDGQILVNGWTMGQQRAKLVAENKAKKKTKTRT